MASLLPSYSKYVSWFLLPVVCILCTILARSSWLWPPVEVNLPWASIQYFLKNPSEIVTYLGSLVGLISMTESMVRNLLPRPLKNALMDASHRIRKYFSPLQFVEVPEFDDSRLCNELYSAVMLHLNAHSGSYASTASRVKVCKPSKSKDIKWSPSTNEDVYVWFEGIRMCWVHHVSKPRADLDGERMGNNQEVDRTFILKVCRRSNTVHLVDSYLKHILDQARESNHKGRERFLYSNCNGKYSFDRQKWVPVPFKHPSSFLTLAIDPALKAQIQEDLLAFSRGESFYETAGRAWKRGYLLHGPPGTGKSSLIAAMANFMRYDVYDLELTSVKSNEELKNLLLKTQSRSIIVIEDIDCSLDLSSQRSKKKHDKKRRDRVDDEDVSSVTLSGLLNFTDGLFSCCGEEKIFVFTTNHIENLDPALLRSGRMDMHILLSYCGYEAFRVLARNYLGIEGHDLYKRVEEIIDAAHITPADVTESLIRWRDEPDVAMEKLVEALEEAKAKPWPPTSGNQNEEPDEASNDEEEEPMSPLEEDKCADEVKSECQAT